MASASVPSDRLELLAAIKAHSQHLTEGPGLSGDVAGDDGGGWSSEEWRGAFEYLVRANPFAADVALSGCPLPPNIYICAQLLLTMRAALADAHICRVLCRTGPNLRSRVVNCAPATFTSDLLPFFN